MKITWFKMRWPGAVTLEGTLGWSVDGRFVILEALIPLLTSAAIGLMLGNATEAAFVYRVIGEVATAQAGRRRFGWAWECRSRLA